MAFTSASNRASSLLGFSHSSMPSFSPLSLSASPTTPPATFARGSVRLRLRLSRRKTISCKAAVGEASAPISAEERSYESKIGARVRVKVSRKVFHVPRVPEVDLTGMEGHIKQYVGVWKGKRISASLPFRVEFVTDVGSRGPFKFFAHLKEDEFDYVD